MTKEPTTFDIKNDYLIAKDIPEIEPFGTKTVKDAILTVQILNPHHQPVKNLHVVIGYDLEESP